MVAQSISLQSGTVEMPLADHYSVDFTLPFDWAPEDYVRDNALPGLEVHLLGRGSSFEGRLTPQEQFNLQQMYLSPSFSTGDDHHDRQLSVYRSLWGRFVDYLASLPPAHTENLSFNHPNSRMFSTVNGSISALVQFENYVNGLEDVHPDEKKLAQR